MVDVDNGVNAKKSSAHYNSKSKEDFINRNLDKLKTIRFWALWYPDLFLDMLKPETGGINLCYDQRLSMRADARFPANYFTASRGSSKTFNNVAIAMINCIVYPSTDIAISAQTVERAAAILKEKYNELVRFFPKLENEVKKTTFTRNAAEIIFKNESRLNVLPNSQSAKGSRRRRLRIEESALLKKEEFEDALSPVVEVPRSTVGKLAIASPLELNGQINFYTSAGWRGSDEFDRVVKMRQNMSDLGGDFVLGSSWMIPSWYGRGSSKAKIIEIKKSVSPTSFNMNYDQIWTGCASGALVSINRLLKCRTLTEPVFEPNKDDECYIGVDVARSQNAANNQSSIAVARVKRNDKSGRVQNIEIINLFNVANTLNFTNQAVVVKNLQRQYNAKAVVLDANGLGIGLVDELLKNTHDPKTGDFLQCFGSINTSNQSEDPQNEIQCLYEMKAQTAQTKIVGDFINAVDSGMLRLLEQKQYDVFAAERDEQYQQKFMPYIQTDLLIEEVANLKLDVNGKNLSVKKEVSRIDKDRFSALAYVIYYILEYENNVTTQKNAELDEVFWFRQPKIRA